MKSSIYEGQVIHTRYLPKKHTFTYRLFMSYLDLDELGHVFKDIPFFSDDGKKNIAYFKREDYLKPSHLPIKRRIQQIIFNQVKIKHSGPIRMLTHLRILGCCFNPVTFYYCFNDKDTHLDFVVADITNTPWNERHQYLIDLKNTNQMTFPKTFHISPFMDMDMEYKWQFFSPSDKIKIKMLANKKECFFKANLFLTRREISTIAMNKMLLKHCFINYKVIWGIYWQATKLYLKQLPFYSHPDQ